MQINQMIEQLTKLKEAYGNIEIDVLSSNCFYALQSDICLRIDEFGDILGVIKAYEGYTETRGKFNQVIQNDSWMQFKDVNMSEKEAKQLWMEAGKPSRMQHKEIQETSDKNDPFKDYSVDRLKEELHSANLVMSGALENETKLNNKLSELSFKNTWYDREGYSMPLNKWLIVECKDKSYMVGKAHQVGGNVVFDITYELKKYDNSDGTGQAIEMGGRPSWCNRWKVFEFPDAETNLRTFLVGRKCGGLPEIKNDKFTEPYNIVKAKTHGDAIRAYNEYHNCAYFYGDVMAELDDGEAIDINDICSKAQIRDAIYGAKTLVAEEYKIDFNLAKIKAGNHD